MGTATNIVERLLSTVEINRVGDIVYAHLEVPEHAIVRISPSEFIDLIQKFSQRYGYLSVDHDLMNMTYRFKAWEVVEKTEIEKKADQEEKAARKLEKETEDSFKSILGVDLAEPGSDVTVFQTLENKNG